MQGVLSVPVWDDSYLHGEWLDEVTAKLTKTALRVPYATADNEECRMSRNDRFIDFGSYPRIQR